MRRKPTVQMSSSTAKDKDKANTNKISLATLKQNHSSSNKSNEQRVVCNAMRQCIYQWTKMIYKCGSEDQISKMIKQIESGILEYVQKMDINVKVKAHRYGTKQMQNMAELNSEVELVCSLLRSVRMSMFSLDKALPILRIITNAALMLSAQQKHTQTQTQTQTAELVNRWSSFIKTELINICDRVQACTESVIHRKLCFIGLQIATCAMKLRKHSPASQQVCAMRQALLESTTCNYPPKQLPKEHRQTLLQHLLQSIAYQCQHCIDVVMKRRQSQLQYQSQQQQQQQQQVVGWVIQVCSMYLEYMEASVLSMRTIALLHTVKQAVHSQHRQQYNNQQQPQWQQTRSESRLKLHHQVFDAVFMRIWVSIAPLQQLSTEELYHLSMLMCSTLADITTLQLRSQVANKWLYCYTGALTTQTNHHTDMLKVLQTYMDEYTAQSLVCCLCRPVQRQGSVLNICHLQSTLSQLITHIHNTDYALTILTNLCALVALIVTRVGSHGQAQCLAWLFLMMHDEIVKRVYFGHAMHSTLNKYFFVLLMYKISAYLSILYASDVQNMQAKSAEWLISCIKQQQIDSALREHMRKTLLVVGLQFQNVGLVIQFNNALLLGELKQVKLDIADCEDCCSRLVQSWVHNTHNDMNLTELHHLLAANTLNLLNTDRLGFYSALNLLIITANSSSFAPINTTKGYIDNKAILGLLRMLQMMHCEQSSVSAIDVIDTDFLIKIVLWQDRQQPKAKDTHNQMQDQSNSIEFIAKLVDHVAVLLIQQHTRVHTNTNSNSNNSSNSSNSNGNNQRRLHSRLTDDDDIDQNTETMHISRTSQHQQQQQQQQQQRLQQALARLHQQCEYIVVILAAHCLLAMVVSQARKQQQVQNVDSNVSLIYRLYNAIRNSMLSQHSSHDQQKQQLANQFIQTRIKKPLLAKLAASLTLNTNNHHGAMLTPIIKMFTISSYPAFEQLQLIKEVNLLYQSTYQFMDGFWGMHDIDAAQWKVNQGMGGDVGAKLEEVHGTARVIRKVKKIEY